MEPESPLWRHFVVVTQSFSVECASDAWCEIDLNAVNRLHLRDAGAGRVAWYGTDNRIYIARAQEVVSMQLPELARHVALCADGSWLLLSDRVERVDFNGGV